MRPLIFPGDKFPDGAVVKTCSAHGKFITVAGASFAYLPCDKDIGYARYEYYSNTVVAGAEPIRGLISIQTQIYQEYYVFAVPPASLTIADFVDMAREVLPSNERFLLALFNDDRIPSENLGKIVLTITQRLFSLATDDSDAVVASLIQNLCKETKTVVKSMHVHSVEDANVIQDLSERLNKITRYADDVRLSKFKKVKAICH